MNTNKTNINEKGNQQLKIKGEEKNMKKLIKISLVLLLSIGFTFYTLDRLNIIHINLPQFDTKKNLEKKKKISFENKKFIDENLPVYRTKVQEIIYENIDNFFDERVQNIDTLVDELLSFKNKWRSAKGFFSDTAKRENEEYFQSLIQYYMFSEYDIERLIEDISFELSNVYEEYEYEVSKHFETLVKTELGDDIQIGDLKSKIEKEVTKLSSIDVSTMNNEDSAIFLANIIASEVISYLAVSSGILGAGSASAIETFGIGLVLGVFVDYIVSIFWDVEGDLRSQLVTELYELRIKLKDEITTSAEQFASKISKTMDVVCNNYLGLDNTLSKETYE